MGLALAVALTTVDSPSSTSKRSAGGRRNSGLSVENIEWGELLKVYSIVGSILLS